MAINPLINGISRSINGIDRSIHQSAQGRIAKLRQDKQDLVVRVASAKYMINEVVRRVREFQFPIRIKWAPMENGGNLGKYLIWGLMVLPVHFHPKFQNLESSEAP